MKLSNIPQTKKNIDNVYIYINNTLLKSFYEVLNKLSVSYTMIFLISIEIKNGINIIKKKTI